MSASHEAAAPLSSDVLRFSGQAILVTTVYSVDVPDPLQNL